MKKSNTFKTLVLSVVMTLGFVMPMAAQTDGFFRYNEDIYGDRATASGSITNQTFGQDPGTLVTGGITNQQFGVPVGSGLLIMVAAGAGYAVVRRKRARKGVTLLLAAAMLLGMTQSKKNVETIASTSSQEGTVLVTLKVENNSKHNIVLSGSDLGKVTFETGDFLWVVNNNQVSGKLDYIGNDTFQGYIDDDPTHVWSHFSGITLKDNDNLYFCYTSNQNPEMYGAEGMPATPPYFVWDMSNQKDKLFMVSFVKTSKTLGQLKADGELNNLSCMLENKCALVKFQLSEATAEDVVLTNVYSGCRLDIDSDHHNVGASTHNEKSTITLYNPAGSSASDVRWGILMAGDSYATNVTIGGTTLSETITIPALGNNDLYQSVSINNPAPTVDYLFSVSASKTVVFSPGNLQYNPATSAWRFAEHQYDMCTPVTGLSYMISEDGYTYTSVSATEYYAAIQAGGLDDFYTTYDATSQYISSYNGWIDLFGWGRWGSGNPYDISESLTYSWNGDFSGTLAGHNDWYTLSGTNSGEWNYLLKERTDAASKRGYATVEGIYGIIILPDVFTDPNTNNGSGAFVPSATEGWDANVYTGNDWVAMESAGAVFLPASGHRFEEEVRGVMDAGFYWSLTDDSKGGDPSAYCLHFEDDMCSNKDGLEHYMGCSVRLVRTVVSSK